MTLWTLPMTRLDVAANVSRASFRSPPTDWPCCTVETGAAICLVLVYPNALDRWLHANVFGGWCVDPCWVLGWRLGVTLAFEDPNDAVLFRLKGGETAWHSDLKQDF